MTGRGRATPRSGTPRARAVTKRRLQEELDALRARLAEAEATLQAIGNDEVDALVVVTRATGSEEVRTIDGAHVAYRHFVETMRDGALTIDEDGTILHANRRFAELAGRDDVVGTALAALLEHATPIDTLLQNVGPEPLLAHATVVRADGSKLPVELSASVLPLDGVRRIGILVTEASRRPVIPRATTQLPGPTPSAPLESVLCHLPLGIVVVDALTGLITYANGRAEQLLGRVLVGVERPVSHVELTAWRSDGSVLEFDERPISRVMSGEPTVSEVLVRLRGDGTVVQTRSTAVPVHDDDGRLAFVVLALEDISEASAARAERERSDHLRELFIGVLGHDLRDPLAAIVMGASLLLDSDDIAPEHTRVLERIASSAERMGRMVTDILDFTRGRVGGGIPLHRAPVDLHAIVRAAVAEVEVAYPRRAVEVVTSGSIIGEWDGDRLAQVVSNLLTNAMEHGDPAKPVRVRLAEEHGSLRLEVHNDGHPIPEAALPLLFDPFRRGGARGSSTKGLGLGLYIAQQIVRAHGGTLTVESSPDRGTTFTVVLPRVAGQKPRI